MWEDLILQLHHIEKKHFSPLRSALSTDDATLAHSDGSLTNHPAERPRTMQASALSYPLSYCTRVCIEPITDLIYHNTSELRWSEELTVAQFTDIPTSFKYSTAPARICHRLLQLVHRASLLVGGGRALWLYTNHAHEHECRHAP